MVTLDDIREPITTELLIGFTDLRGFLRASRQLGSSQGIFDFLNRLAAVIEAAVDQSSGRIIKYIGDAALIVFPGENADEGVRTLVEVLKACDAFIKGEGIDTKMAAAAHYGEVTIGPFGGKALLDVFGEGVNRAAMTERDVRRTAFAITPDAFRKLKPGTRTLFQKYTPPITYQLK